MTKKCHIIKNMPNKKKKQKKDFFTSPEDRMYITVSLCLVSLFLVSNERQTYL